MPSTSSVKILGDTISTFLSSEAKDQMDSLLKDIEDFEKGKTAELNFQQMIGHDLHPAGETLPGPHLYRLPKPLLISYAPLNVTKDKNCRMYPGKERGKTGGEVSAAKAKGYDAFKKLLEDGIVGDDLVAAMQNIVDATESQRKG